MKLFDLTGKVALVTGGNGGIGLGDGAGDGVVRRVDRDRRAQCGEGGPGARLAARAWRDAARSSPAT